jgi:hypothetical protein
VSCAPSKYLRYTRADRHDQDDSERPTQQRNASYADQVTPRKLDANGKHEQDHANFGEKLECVDVSDAWAGSEGANQDSAKT